MRERVVDRRSKKNSKAAQDVQRQVMPTDFGVAEVNNRPRSTATGGGCFASLLGLVGVGLGLKWVLPRSAFFGLLVIGFSVVSLGMLFGRD